jgi:pSer/pThr/pTyr-binding forkhead associated (FHA) protein
MFNSPHFIIRLMFNNNVIEQIISTDIKKDLNIGRHEDCDWQIPPADRTASNHHATLFLRHGRVFLRDNGSHNGTYYKGVKIKERQLAAGDRYGIGDALLVVLEDKRDEGKGARPKYHRLEQLNGSGRGRMFELKDREYIIGSDQLQAQIVCEEQLISRKHAKLSLHEDGSCWVVNLESRNGVQINRMPLARNNEEGRMLRDGDVISLAQLDFKFYDKHVVSVRSYFWLKAVATVCTLVLGIAFWVLYASLGKSADQYLEQARRYAAAERFDGALVILAKADTARHAEIFRETAAELARNIRRWKSTCQNWQLVKENLENSEWGEANTILMPLVSSPQEIWNWSDQAVQSKQEAILSSNVLEKMLRVRSNLEKEQSTHSQSQEETEALARALQGVPPQVPPFLTSLVSYSRDILEEAQYTIAQQQAVTDILEGYQKASDSVVVLGRCEAKYQEIEERIEARKTAEKLYCVQVQAKLNAYFEPLRMLKQANDLLERNLDRAATLQFEKIVEDISLPSVEQCSVYPVFNDRRKEIDLAQRTLLESMGQLKSLIASLSNNGIATGSRPPEIDYLFSENVWQRVISCDCFQHPVEQWRWDRKEPLGDYDKMCGIEVFREFVSSLNMDYPLPFEGSSLLDGRSWEPVLVGIRRLFSDLQMFQEFLNDPFTKMLLGRRPLPRNHLLDLAMHVVTLLDERDDFAARLMELSRKATKDREALIYGGSALMLARNPVKQYLPDYGRLAGIYRRNRLEVEKLSHAEGAPAVIMESMRQMVDIGFPGDPLVKQAQGEIFGK